MRVPHQPADINNPLQDYPESFLDCRDMKHVRPSRADPSGGINWKCSPRRDRDTGHIAEMSRTMFCARGCGTLLTDITDTATGQQRTEYTHPEGYPMPKGHA